jgi:Trypsin-like peptidase domain
MNAVLFFYKLYILDSVGLPVQFLGTAFPVTPNGGLLTCRHVVNVTLAPGQAIAVFDNEGAKFTRLPSAPLYPGDSNVDIAFIPNALDRQKSEYFPLLTPQALNIGEDVYSFGFFAIGGDSRAVEQGYFAGKIVNFFNHERSVTQASFTLPYAVLEGMSGSPVLTYHNGPKVMGIAIGNRSSRILASEIIEYKDNRREFKESVNRIVEFGVGHHCAAIVSFLREAAVQGFVVSADNVQVAGL